MYSEGDIPDRPPEALARLMAAADGPDGAWRPEELGAILAHQLRTPVEFELDGLELPAHAAQTPPDLASVHTFRELFQRSKPPLELLRMTKDFAKAHIS